jgi:tripartite-type tricarboxylate transporter receptor subunit TctC
MIKKLLITSLLAFSTVAVAKDNIKIVVPFAAGGPVDVVARQVEKTLINKLDVNVTVEYRTGAGGNIATQFVKDDRSQDTILLVHSSAIVINAADPDAAYNLKTDLTPVAYLGQVPMAMIVNKDLGITSLKQFVNIDKNKPMFFGSGGVGTGTHIAGEVLKLHTKQNLVHVPYKGEAPALTDLLGGRITFIITGLSNATKHPDRVNILAVTGNKRNSLIPTVPTFDEQGITAYDYPVQYSVIYANRGANPQVLTRIQTALAQDLSNPTKLKTWNDIGIIPNPNLLTNFGTFIDENIARNRYLKTRILDK